MNPLAMSDEDVLKMEPPTVDKAAESSSVGSETQPVVDTATSTEVADTTASTATNTEATVEVVTDKVPASEKGEENLVDNAVANAPEKVEKSTEPANVVDKSVAPATDAKDDKKVDETAQAPDYKGFYEKIMVPFKANGKLIELKSPEEVMQLLQMGANYTRKMQELSPHRKVLTMLQNNGLMDEDKLSYLIDLDKRNPEAIKKLVKEAGIDPLDIDTSKEPAYLVGNHKVTDAEVNFRAVLDDLATSPEGKATLQAINDGWDQASKEVLWSTPELMATMHKQREVGIYQQIVDEMDRQKALGKLPPNAPFLEAYRTVGDQIQTNGGFASRSEKPKIGSVVDKRAAVVKPAIMNGEKAKAASPSRSPAKTAKTVVNPLSMPDDEFLKQWANRV